MDDEKRDELRQLQDRFLAHRWVKEFTFGNGETVPMFRTSGSPSAEDLEKYLYPEYEQNIRSFLEVR